MLIYETMKALPTGKIAVAQSSYISLALCRTNLIKPTQMRRRIKEEIFTTRTWIHINIVISIHIMYLLVDVRTGLSIFSCFSWFYNIDHFLASSTLNRRKIAFLTSCQIAHCVKRILKNFNVRQETGACMICIGCCLEMRNADVSDRNPKG